MSDPVSEATRHEYIKVPRYLVFFGGGLVAVLFVAIGLWMTVTTEEAVEEPPETVAEVDFKRMAARVAAVRAVAPKLELSERRPIRARLTRQIASGRELAEATAAVWAEVEAREGGVSVLVVEEGSTFGLEITPPNWDPMTVRLAGIERYLQAATRGEEYFGDMGPSLPEWVPAYPGARGVLHAPQVSPDYPGYAALMVGAPVGEVVDWYQDVADLISRGGTDPSGQAPTPVETVRMGPDGGIRERFAMKWGEQFVTLAATEDELGGSLVVLFFIRRDG